MFKGGQANPYDDIVSEYNFTLVLVKWRSWGLMNLFIVKTTDENLTGENWELILNLCDKVQDEGEQGYAGYQNRF